MSGVERSFEYKQGSMISNPDLILDRLLDVKYMFSDLQREHWLTGQYIPWVQQEWAIINTKIGEIGFAPCISEGNLGRGRKMLRKRALAFGKILSEETDVTAVDAERMVRFSYVPGATDDILVTDFVSTPEGELKSMKAELFQHVTGSGGIKSRKFIRKAELDIANRKLIFTGGYRSGFVLSA